MTKTVRPEVRLDTDGVALGRKIAELVQELLRDRLRVAERRPRRTSR
jgi:hypothetical protein